MSSQNACDEPLFGIEHSHIDTATIKSAVVLAPYRPKLHRILVSVAAIILRNKALLNQTEK